MGKESGYSPYQAMASCENPNCQRNYFFSSDCVDEEKKKRGWKRKWSWQKFWFIWICPLCVLDIRLK